jgi:hypothetical protein
MCGSHRWSRRSRSRQEFTPLDQSSQAARSWSRQRYDNAYGIAGPSPLLRAGGESLLALATPWVVVLMASSSSSRYSSNTVAADRLAEIERCLTVGAKGLAGVIQRLTVVEEQVAKLAAACPDQDGWERLQAYAKRKGLSVRTVDRRVATAQLEKRKDPGTNCAYVREISPSQPRPKRGRRRQVPTPGDDAALGATVAPGAPIWPYGGH